MATKTATSSNGQKKSGQLEKFFLDQLKDIYYAEQQLLKALNEMKSASTTEELEDAFDNHHKQTERQVKRLEKVFQLIDEKPEGKKCEAMDGLIKEGKTIINEIREGSMTRDAALIIAAQKVEHYEIATYGSLVQLAKTLGKNDAAEILHQTLEEEKQADEKLTEIAEWNVNQAAAQEAGEEDEEEEEGNDQEEEKVESEEEQ